MLSIKRSVGILLRKIKYCTNLKYLSRAVTGDKIRPLNEDTLTGRFLLYLKKLNSIENVKSNECFNLINTLKHYPRDIVKFDTRQVIKALTLLTDRDFIQNKQDYTKILNLIDKECCNRLKTHNIQMTISLLHSFLSVNPNRLTECHYFNLALEVIVKSIDKLSKEELVQTIFFIGFLKKCNKSQNMLKVCLEKLNNQVINDLTEEDLCIICNSTFKTSTQIKNKLFLKRVKHFINENLSLLKDPAVLITFLKTLRHNRYQDDDILSTLSCTIFFNKTISCYSFTALSHILAVYSDYLYYDEPLLKAFSQEGLNLLKESKYVSKDTYLSEQPRLKDIKRFLWALSNLNYKLEKEDIENCILPQVQERLKDSDPKTIVDIILYMWMMNYKAIDLINECLNDTNIQKIKATNPISQRSLNLLLICMYYEDIDMYNKLKTRPNLSHKYHHNKQLQRRPVLRDINNHFSAISKEFDIDKCDLHCQIPFINIIGITGFRKNIYKLVNIEVLDDYTCLKNTDRVPTGLMDLKLRLLDKCDEALIVI
ncbi:uncharacterized protein LOC143200801 isoform X1 [Rhynchophorus ferrugineus]|uniref:uncharacterized protein LOC143200801 isoform X1 n=1 Tax=Rhynchophorus ferrugineus TaxID=354439 RepID=UPI003FCEDECD